MSGYYRDKEWVCAVVGANIESVEEAEAAVTAAIQRVVSKQSSAQHEMRALLTRYPYLRKDQPDHPLLPLAGLYAKELFE